MSVYDYEKTYHKIFYKSTDEFEQLRSLCLQEDNWLKHNYTKENLIVEDHAGYSVVYQKETNVPIIMAGAYNNGKFPNNVARLDNRLYTFPEFRSKCRKSMVELFRLHHERIIYPLIEVNEYEVYIITMQNRKRKNKGWWDLWRKAMQEASKNMWVEVEGYVQTCPWMVQKCWQNFVYYEKTPGAFKKWNPKILTHEEWIKLPEGA